MSAHKDMDVIGEDATSIEGHVKVLQDQYQKYAGGLTVKDVVNKYPFLKTPSGVSVQIIKIHKHVKLACNFPN